MLFYATKWKFRLDKAQMHLAYSSMIAYSGRQLSASEPIVWEALLLMVLYLLQLPFPPLGLTVRQVALTVVGYLLEFDVYGRSGDLPRALRNKPRAPRGGAGKRTLTLYPSGLLQSSPIRCC